MNGVRMKFVVYLPCLAILTLFACKTANPYSESVSLVDANGRPRFETFVERLGLQMDEKLTVTKILPVSAGCLMGLRRGDKVTALNGESVADHLGIEASAVRNLEGAYSPWCFTVERDGHTLKLPDNCDFEKRASVMVKLGYQCDPRSLTLCGPLTSECSVLD